MNTAFGLYDAAIALLQKLNWLPLLLGRLSVGTIFILSGWGKLHDLPKVTAFFTDLGIPLPEFNAQFVACTELTCGSLVLLGLLTRFASIPLIGTMVVAIITAKRADIHGVTDLFGFEEFIYIVLLILFVIDGAGKASLDHLLCRARGRK